MVLARLVKKSAINIGCLKQKHKISDFKIGSLIKGINAIGIVLEVPKTIGVYKNDSHVIVLWNHGSIELSYIRHLELLKV